MNKWTRYGEPWTRQDVWSFEESVSAAFDRLKTLRNPDPTSWQATAREEATADLMDMLTELFKAIEDGYVYLVAEEEMDESTRDAINAA